MKKLIQGLAHATWDNVDEAVLNAGKKVLIDTLGAMLMGIKEPNTKALLEQMEPLHPGSINVIGTDTMINLHAAALINGAATVAVELDEGNQWSKGHPAAHIVPTMLTYVQTKERYSGQDFMLNLIKGYEACSQFGRATTLLPDAHAHGTWGTMGAAASVMFIEDVTDDDFLAGLNISASFAMPTMWDAALEGALIRNIYVGQAIESGIKTISLLKSSFFAPNDNISYIYGGVIGTEFQLDKFSYSKGARWDIEQNYFKSHAFCRYAHAPLDAFQILILENNIVPSDIKKINVSTYSRAATLNRSNYHNALSAKFSIPFTLSAWIHTKTSAHTVFSKEVLERSDIREMAEKINVITSEELEKDYPTLMPVEVEVILYSGTSYKQRLDNADGGPGEQLPLAEIIKKFKQNTSNIISASRQEEIIDWILNIEVQKDMHELIILLSE